MSKFGSEEFNFPFNFSTKSLPSNEQEEQTRRHIETEKTLKLLGFPDEAVNGWEITPLLNPPVVSNVVCVCVCGCKNTCQLHVTYLFLYFNYSHVD